MSRLAKLKRDHIKEVNKLLDKKFVQEEVKKEQKPLNPSENVQNANSKFLEKMNRLL
tara:strand:- start:246 stop:416 length:171 start_codon:yes stop_codon:yes gene_type:complete